MLSQRLIPSSVRIKCDAERYGISEFVKFASKNIEKSSILIDAGAGDCRYKANFQHVKYVAVDSCQVNKKYAKIDVIADLSFLPFKNNSIDAILSTQTLEHVKEPKLVLSEFFQALKPGGSLFLTVPQGWGQHEKPYDYFRFTSFALEYLLNLVGFRIIFIKPRGGYFWYIGKRIKEVPSFIPITNNVFLKVIRNFFHIICAATFGILLPICVFISTSSIKKKTTL